MAKLMVNKYENGELVYREATPEEAAELGELQAKAAAVAATQTTAAANYETLRVRADDAIATLENAIAGWAGLTAAQKDASQKLGLRVTVALVRLVLRRLESAGA